MQNSHFMLTHADVEKIDALLHSSFKYVILHHPPGLNRSPFVFKGVHKLPNFECLYDDNDHISNDTKTIKVFWMKLQDKTIENCYYERDDCCTIL